MRLVCTLVVIGALATPVWAGPKLLVMRAESSADWESRVRVEKAVMAIARNVDRGVGLSDSTFKSVSDMIGCTGSVAECKEQVIETLAIDEVVIISITPTGTNQLNVSVQRAAKRGFPKEASAVVDKASPEPALTASIGPLFGASRGIEPPAKPEPPPPKPTGPPPKPTAPPIATKGEPAPTASAPSHVATVEPTPAAPITPEPSRVAAVEPAATPAQPDHVDAPAVHRSRAGIALVAGGAVLMVTGAVLWNRASNIEDDINNAPNRTPADVDRLLDLEARGDRYALWGNVAFATGVVAAGVGGYLFWRSGRVSPMVSAHGGGVAVTWEVP